LTNVENLILPLVIACALSCVLSVASIVWCCIFSGPASLRKEMDGVRAQVEASFQAFKQLEGNFLTHRTEIQALAESVEGMLDSVERKRRQVTAAASRVNGPALEAVPQTREEILAHARKITYG
jgi:predicted metal-binding transcription factor (methanogenesis marker protein 9)